MDTVLLGKVITTLISASLAVYQAIGAKDYNLAATTALTALLALASALHQQAATTKIEALQAGQDTLKAQQADIKSSLPLPRSTSLGPGSGPY